jgi:SRSO17 transposase
VGLLAETRHKSLPRLGKTVHADPQALHHFLAKASWSVDDLRTKRLDLLRQALGATPFILCLDETGDRKKGHTTDYVASQYIGNLHTLANGVVSVNAYGLLGTTTFPLLFRIFKPESQLKPGDVYKSKPQLAIEIVEELVALGFRIRVVLADSLYGESGPFISALHRLGLQYVVALRSHHGVWLLPGQRIRQTRWRPFERVFTDGSSEQRFIRETIYGTRTPVRYYQITTDPHTLPRETTWDLMTNQPGDSEETVGNMFGWRTWVEYGFKSVFCRAESDAVSDTPRHGDQLFQQPLRRPLVSAAYCGHIVLDPALSWQYLAVARVRRVSAYCGKPLKFDESAQ